LGLYSVTPKGSGAEQNEFDAYTFTCIATLVTLTAVGVIINLLPEWSPILKGEFSVVAMYWAAANNVVLVIAALICFEKRRPSVDSFFIGDHVQFDGQSRPAQLASLSLDSGVINLPWGLPIAIHNEIAIEADGFPLLPSRVESIGEQQMEQVSVRFKHSLNAAARDQLIVKLYASGRYAQEIQRLDTLAIISGLWKRAFGRLATEA
jgi:hypothetical protein